NGAASRRRDERAAVSHADLAHRKRILPDGPPWHPSCCKSILQRIAESTHSPPRMLSKGIETMEGRYETHTRRRLRFGALASAIVLATGLGACERGGEARDAQPAGPAELGADPGDIDIGARSTEAATAERNEAAARADDAETGSENPDSALGAQQAEDASAETRIAAAGSTGAVSAAATIEP